MVCDTVAGVRFTQLCVIISNVVSLIQMESAQRLGKKLNSQSKRSVSSIMGNVLYPNVNCSR